MKKQDPYSLPDELLHRCGAAYAECLPKGTWPSITSNNRTISWSTTRVCPRSSVNQTKLGHLSNHLTSLTSNSHRPLSVASTSNSSTQAPPQTQTQINVLAVRLFFPKFKNTLPGGHLSLFFSSRFSHYKMIKALTV